MRKYGILGRRKEIGTLEKLYDSKRSEFVALYGRRRVGKTFLIKQLFSEKYTFQVTGLSNLGNQEQLTNFYTTLTRTNRDLQDKPKPVNWFEAFQLLIDLVEKSQQTRKIVFIDELPWFDTPKSDFISALEHFWNGWAYHRNDILLIVCGSAASWMINKIINNHGGLHNRVTTRIHLQPFTLNEVEAFLQQKGAVFRRYDLLQLYMVMGGIPFYLDQINTKVSIAQNIDELFFNHHGLLRTEYNNLYRSLFKKPERHMAVIEALAKKGKGLTRKELLKASGLSNGGRFTEILDELEQCGFIKKRLPFGNRIKDSLFQLTDPYTLFYMKFVKDSRASGQGAWMSQLDSPSWRAWSGIAFEYICRYHIQNIKKHLGIAGVYTEISTWRSKEVEQGAQIDLIIDRRDRVINICEMKFSVKPFVIDKSYAKTLQQKLWSFMEETGTTKTLFLTFITTFGLKENSHSTGLVQQSLDMNILFD